MKIVICDDDLDFCEQLSNNFKGYFNHLIDDIDMSIVSSAKPLMALSHIDILFMDIDLPNENGIVLAKYIAEISPSTIIIFVSSREDLIFNALSVPLFQFIRKSKYEEDIVKVFKQLFKYIQKHNRKMVIDIKGRRHVIALNDVQYMLSIGRELLIKTTMTDYVIISSIKEILNRKEVKEYKDLIQINRSQIVNLNYVEHILSSNVLLKDHNQYTIGRKYRNNVDEKYLEYILRC